MSSSQRMYEQLHAAISCHELLPGMKLKSENQYCLEYGISRPTVRGVLGRLQEAGLVETYAGKGTFVRSPDFDFFSVPQDDFQLGLDIDFDVSQHYYGAFLQGILKSPLGRKCLFRPLGYIRTLSENPPSPMDGMIFLRIGEFHHEEYLRALKWNIPLMMINWVSPNPDISYITVDHMQEAERAVSYMLQSGLRRIVLAGASPSLDAGFLRARGWENAYRKAGMEIPEDLILSREDLMYFSGRVIDFVQHRKFDGIFFTNAYALSRFTISYMNEFCRLPDRDYSLMCFDDPTRQYGMPDMTVNYVKMPVGEMARTAIEYLMQKKREPEFPVLRRIVPASLVVND